MSAALGFAYRYSDDLTFTCDFQWTDWSSYKMHRHDDGVDYNPVTGDPLGSSEECLDIFSCRMGAEYLIHKNGYIIPLRCGLAYDPAPAAGERDELYRIHFGTGFQKGRYAFDIGYSFSWGNHMTPSPGYSGHQKQRTHRLMMSLIYYF